MPEEPPAGTTTTEETPPPAPTSPPAAPSSNGGGGDGTDWKAEAKKWESRAKENFDKAKELDELKESQKTEQQKLEDRATKAEGALTPLQAENARLKVAIAKQLPADLAERLRGDTVEELEADADKLLALVKGERKPPAFDGGTRTTPQGGEDMNAFIKRARDARRGG